MISILLVFIIGISLRLLFINTREIAYDDAFSYFLARNDYQKIIMGTSFDTMPPLYYFLLHNWLTISKALWFLRLLNIFINLLTGIFVYKLAGNLFNKRTAGIAVLLYMISPFQIYHSQELRMYALLEFGQIGFYFSILKLINDKGKHQIFWSALSIIFGVIAMYSHNLGFIGIIAVNLVGFWIKNKKTFLKIIGIEFGILILSSPWFYFLPQQIEKVQAAFWTIKPGLIDIIQSPLTLFSFLPMPLVITAFALIVILQSFIFLLINTFRSKSKTIYLVCSLFFFTPVLLFIMSYVVKPVFVPRIFIASSVWFFILFAYFIMENWKVVTGKINLILFILMCAISLPFYYGYNLFPRSQFSNLSTYLNKLDKNIAIIHENKLSFFPTIFYKETRNSFYIMDEPGTPNDTLATGSQIALGYIASNSIDDFLDREHLYFVAFQQSIDEYEQMGIENPNIMILKNHYGFLEEKKIGDLIIFDFGEKD